MNADYVAPQLTVGDLFSGIGGGHLGLERAGMNVIWHSEIDKYASKVLARHWPSVPNLGDITKIDWSEVERPDVVAGGFPCQSVSAAGRQRAQADERWLWPEFARCIRNLRPSYVIVENVPNLLGVDSGRAAQEVFGDLALLGFDAEWGVLPAASFGAPHLRKRVFVVAYARSEGLEVERLEPDGHERQATERGGPGGRGTTLADADEVGRGRGTGVIGERRWPEPEDGGWWAVEPDVGRMAHGIPGRVDRIRCLGNSVVPQVMEYVGRRLLAAHIDGSTDA